RLLAPDLWIRSRSEVARSRATGIGASAQLFGVVRLVAGTGPDQSPLRSGLHRVLVTGRFQLHPDRICGANSRRRKEVRRTLRRSAAVVSERDLSCERRDHRYDILRADVTVM